MNDDDKYPSQLAERFQIRLPDGMRDRIRVEAEKNNRSMNAEIVATLEEKYPSSDDIDNELLMMLHGLTEADKVNFLKFLTNYIKEKK